MYNKNRRSILDRATTLFINGMAISLFIGLLYSAMSVGFVHADTVNWTKQASVYHTINRMPAIVAANDTYITAWEMYIDGPSCEDLELKVSCVSDNNDTVYDSSGIQVKE